MRMKILLLSFVTLALAAFSASGAAATPQVRICDESGRCAACCTLGEDCVSWCVATCGSDNCPVFENPLCCSGGEWGIECGHAT